jgi:hypothetical protein
VKISKRTVAREWLIFVLFFGVGFIPSIFIAKSAGGISGAEALFLWFALYLTVQLLRSIWWSIKTLRMPRRQHELD